ncbi:MAG: hypothetical protein KME28_05385 [Pelatocladus maniniholoensis HA4357-MV3]|jgi:hypothetical protein|uniref:Uncharacterized protein n=1 Tax=Pelatocladus maniniholoensis HA4357-MV3 TaxID=1117104 RepID=A0A9E3H637_9NOST|nr:hypothetical protein [Pelatocladus maniniholoensis HA4357-MV3]BAZ69594.1 hypothetical protein NIES4106_43670 [Fischerella sp. NIES-4106]
MTPALLLGVLYYTPFKLNQVPRQAIAIVLSTFVFVVLIHRQALLMMGLLVLL